MNEPHDTPKSHGGEVCAVVVTFNPDAEISARLDQIASGVSHLIIVDNTEGDVTPSLAPASIGGSREIMRNGRNIGPASALNIGVRRAVALGYPYVLILDQDSVPQPGMVETLVKAHQDYPERDRVALVAPQPIEPSLGSRPRYLRKRKWFLFELVECEDATLDNVTIVIASGALLPSVAVVALGPFRDDFFIDYIDTEYCLRALSQGYRIIVAGNAHLHHRLGERKAATWGPFAFFPTMHPVSRWYYMGRNRIPTLAGYGMRFPHWAAFDLMHGAYTMLRMLLTEDKRVEKLAAFARGTRDGLRGRMGPMHG